MCLHPRVRHNTDTLVGQKKFKKLGQQRMPRAKEIFPLAILVTRAISTPVTKKGIKITGVAG